MCEDLSKISSYFTLHLIKVGKLKRFKKVSSDLKTILKTDFYIELAVWERRSMSINLNYVAWKKPEVMKIGCVWSFFWLEEFKIILLVLKYLLAYLGSSVKTTIIWPRCACDSSNIFQTKTNQGPLGHLIAVPSCILFGKPPVPVLFAFFFKTLFNRYRFEIAFVRPCVSVSFLKADMYIFF